MTEQKIRFAKALLALAEYYGRELSDGVIALYWQGLRQYSIADIEAAIGRHLQNPDSGQWMPKIADIVRMIDGTTQSAAAMAWAKIMRAVGSVGQYQSLAFDDALIHLVIDDLGGWPGVCQIDEAEIPFLQKRFETSYRAYRMRGTDVPAHLPYLVGVSEMQNATKGYQSEPPRLVGDLERARAVMAGGSDLPRLPVHAADAVLPVERLRLIGKASA
jgi:Domain of unknown function (DUF6475)